MRRKAGRTGKLFSLNTHLFHNSVAEKLLCPSRFNTAGSGKATGEIRMGSSLLSSSASPQWPPCQTSPPSWEQRTCSFISPSLITGRHPKLVPLPCHHWAGWLRCSSWQWAKNITRHLAWPYPVQIQNEHQEHPAHRCGLDGAWCCLHCQSCTMGMEKGFVNNPAQSSTTSFFNKCVTLPEKLLVFSSQTKLIFL